MEFVILFIGLSVGIMLRDLFKVLKVFLSLLSAYWWIDYRHPFTFPSFQNLDFKYIFLEFPYQWEAFKAFAFFMLLFYYVIPLFMRKYVITFSHKQKAIFESFDIEKRMPNYFAIVFSIASFISFFVPKNISYKNPEFNVEKFADNYISTFLIILHLGTFICLTLNDFIWSSIIVVIVFLINFLGLPIIFGIYNQLINYIEKKLSKDQ